MQMIQGIKYNKAKHKNLSEKHEEENFGIKYHKLPRTQFQNGEIQINVKCCKVKKMVRALTMPMFNRYY